MRRLSISAIGLVLLATVGATPSRADPSVTIISAGAALMALANYGFGTPDLDGGRGFVSGGAALFDYPDQDEQAAEFRASYWGPWSFVKIRPFMAVSGTSDGTVTGSLGIRQDVHVGENLVFSWRTAPTLYLEGGGKDLGSAGVLRSGIEVGYRFADASRLTLSFDHMSHGELFGDLNPGTETIGVDYVLPLSRLVGK